MTNAMQGVDRVREFLYQKILKIREESPMRTNIQLHQQNQLLPYRYFLNVCAWPDPELPLHLLDCAVHPGYAIWAMYHSTRFNMPGPNRSF
jgi:hypothetical protein